MNAVPPKIAPANLRFLWTGLALVGTGIAAFVYFFNPAVHHFYPVCQFHRLTGLNCPGCGGTRALYALLHGHFAAALRDNALFVIAIPLLALRAGWLACQHFRQRPVGSFFSVDYLLPLVVILGVFGVLRNLPAFSFLSP